MDVVEGQGEVSELDLDESSGETRFDDIEPEDVTDFLLSVSGLLFLLLIVMVTASVALATAAIRHA